MGSDGASSTTGFLGSIAPSISADGTRIAFESNRDPLGSNADANFEIFLFDTTTGLTQITNTTGGNNSVPSINADGTRIAFESTRDLVGSNADGNREIFLFDTTSGLTQITSTTGFIGNTNPSINADGTRIAFDSNRDPLGTNADGNIEIFLFDTTSGLTQITSTTGGGNREPSINADGTRIAFEATSDPLGTNADGNSEIFLFDITSGLTQITNTTGGNNNTPSINANGTRIAFWSNHDPLGTNADGNAEIFLFDTTSGLTQITSSTGGGNEEPSINADGTRIAFQSDRDLVGTNADGNREIFTADVPLKIFIDTTAPNTPLLDLVETSDTGRDNSDNITSDNTPTVTIVANDTIDGDGNPFWHDIKYRIYDRPGDGSGEVLIVDSFAKVPGFTTLGFFEEILSRELNNPNGLPLHDGVHNLKLEVEDRAGNISHDFLLTLVIDTHMPSTFFGLPELAYDGLDHSSDSDVDVDPPTNSDRVTNDTTPTFFGTAEADSIIQVYVVDAAGNQVLIGQTVAVPIDGNFAYPGGRWEVTSALDLNDPSLGFPRDGLRQIEVVGEDVAGNISYGQADVSAFGNAVFDLLPPPGPTDIPDGGQSGLGLSLPGIAGRIIDVDVKLSIEHSNVEDLDVTLQHIDSFTTIELFSDVGGDGNHFINTVLDDEADVAITAGAAPFSGTFRPEGSLSAFDGLDADALWFLFIRDDTVNDESGSFFRYDLVICVKLSPLEIFLDTQGPRVYDPDAGGPDQPIQVISDGVLDPEFNIFDIKPTTGPTPRVDGLKINIEDLPPRFVNSSPEFLAARSGLCGL